MEGLEGNCANKFAAGEEASREDTVDIHCRDKIRCQDDLLVYGHLEWGKEASRMSAGSLAWTTGWILMLVYELDGGSL